MGSNERQEEVYIRINDIFDELSEENKRLKNELMFANNCLKVFYKLKLFLSKICVKFETIIDSEDKQELNQLEEEFNSFVVCEEQIKETNAEIIDKGINGSIEENSDETNDRRSGRTEPKLYAIYVKRKAKPKSDPKSIAFPEPEEEPNSLLLMKRNNFEVKTQSYVCPNPYCNKFFPTHRRLYQHFYLSHYKTKQYSCDHQNCNKSFKTRNHLFKHSIVHSEVWAFVCPIEGCDYKTKRQRFLDKHLANHSDIPIIPEPEEEPNSKLLLRRNNFDAKTQSYVCPNPYCDKSFFTNIRLYHHFHAVHYMKKQYSCDYKNCNKSFKTRNDLTDHSVSHSDIRSFVCPFQGCDYRSKRQQTLTQHLVVHSDVKTYKCSECEKTFKLKSTLRRHELLHKSQPSFRCTFEGCHQFLKNAYYLNRHKRLVHNIQPKTLRCDWPGCDYQNIRHNNLTIHKRLHTGEKPYPCEWPHCGKRFRLKKHLNEHLLVHKDLRPFACVWPGCQYSCRTGPNLKNHIKNIHQK